jgi:succinate dehydrogenase / fumarate reductase cytochrome b subunit
VGPATRERNSTVSSVASPSAIDVVSTDANIRHFLLRRLHSLTGIVFGGYLVVHLLVNASLIEGARHDGQPTVFQVQVDKIHSLPFLVGVEIALIYLPILYHTIYGLWITVTGRPNVANYPYGKNWFYVLQRASAVVLVAFMLFHILAMKGVFGGDVGRMMTFAPLHATESTVNHFHAAWWVGWVIYPIGILASCYHLANGFWTAAITWGLTISKQAQKRWGLVCSGLFVLTFACGLTALAATLRASAGPIPSEDVPAVRGLGPTGTPHATPNSSGSQIR